MIAGQLKGIILSQISNRAQQTNQVMQQVKNCIDKFAMLSPDAGAPVLLMVSGGSDSVACLKVFTQLFGNRNLHILHINHMLRGKDADEDERFVLNLAQRITLPCKVYRIDVAALAKDGGSNIEDLARQVRYKKANEYLDELCATHGFASSSGRIVTAHTQNDRVETFLMRVIVGGGVGSLASVPYCNRRIIRPLLDCSRQDLQDWLKSIGQPWREDLTNLDTTKLRAYVRHDIILRLKEKNPQLLQTVSASLDNMAIDNAALNALCDKLEPSLLSTADGGLRLHADAFLQDKALLRRIIYRCCKKVMPLGGRVTSWHITTIADKGKTLGFALDLPGAARVENRYGQLVFLAPLDSDKDSPMPRLTWSVAVDLGKGAVLPDGTTLSFEALATDVTGDNPLGYARTHSAKNRVFIDADKFCCAAKHEKDDSMPLRLQLSYIQEGDRFCPLGMQGHHRKVSDVLVDRKIERHRRAHVIKASVYTGKTRAQTAKDEQIVWLINIQLDERFKVCPQTTSMFSILVDV